MNSKTIKLSGFLFLILGLGNLQAQNAVPGAGGDATGNHGTASYSVGLVAYSSSGNSIGSVSNGIQQGYTFVLGDTDSSKEIRLTAVYPNPATTEVHLMVDNENLESLSYKLFDSLGKLLISEKIEKNETPISMEKFPSATYFLKVTDNKSELRNFTIIKNN